MPIVSVVLSVYNEEQNLPSAIESILGQTYKDYELICCDDKSTDGSLSVLSLYKEKYPEKIQIIENIKNRGQAFSRNRCIKKAKGSYIAIMDADDMCDSTRLEKQIDYLSTYPEIAFVGTGMTFFDEHGTWATRLFEEFPPRKKYVPHAPYCLASCMFRRDALEAVGNYNENPFYRSGEDLELVVSLVEHGYQGANINEPLYFCREGIGVYKKWSIYERLTEALKIANIVRRLRLPVLYYLYVLRPLALAFLPRRIYMKLHRNALKKESYE